MSAVDRLKQNSCDHRNAVENSRTSEMIEQKDAPPIEYVILHMQCRECGSLFGRPVRRRVA